MSLSGDAGSDTDSQSSADSSVSDMQSSPALRKGSKALHNSSQGLGLGLGLGVMLRYAFVDNVGDIADDVTP